MPIYDPTLRGAASRLSTGGTSTASVPKPAGTVDGDLIIVSGEVAGDIQINPPDGTWTRINGVVSGYQAFWKHASGEPASWTFTWNATNQAYVFNVYSFYSAGGGTVSLDALVSSEVFNTFNKTSDAITPSADALVLVDFIIFRDETPTVPTGLTFIQNSSGCAAGSVYVTSGIASLTYTSTVTGSPGFNWGSGTFSIISSVSTLHPPLVSDEAVSTPGIRTIADIVFRRSSQNTAFPFFTGAQLNPARPDDVLPGDLLLAHIWSNGTAPGALPFRSIPVGWTLLPGSYVENHAINPPSASWVFYKVAGSNESDITNYQWLLPAPTVNIWTVILYVFRGVDPAHLFDGFQTATGYDGSPRAPSLTPDWRNDVSLLLFAAINPPGVQVPLWPIRPNAPAGYVLLDALNNQGTFQVGYIGSPNSCNPVPDEFAYTEAQQVAILGNVRYRSPWFGYSFLLKNINVIGQSCGIAPPPPPHPGGMRDGNLVGFTFNEEQQVIAWHRHPMIGALETIACIPSPNGNQDDLWMVVNRTINGVTRRYIEYMAPHFLTGDDLATQSLYSDSGGTYNGVPTKVVTGLDRLEGQTLKVLTDGSRHPDVVVTGGQITLNWVASIVQYGLPQTCRLTTMPIEAPSPGGGTAQAKVKRIVDITFRFLNTLGGRAGREDPDAELSDPPQTVMDTLEFRDPDDPMDERLKVYNGLWPEETYAMNWPAGSEVEGRMTYVNDEPYPVTIVGMYPNLETED